MVIFVGLQNTLTSGCISSPVLRMGSKAGMLSDYTDTKSLQSARNRVLSSGQLDISSSYMSRSGKLPMCVNLILFSSVHIQIVQLLSKSDRSNKACSTILELSY